jgi:hypothetical protein
MRLRELEVLEKIASTGNLNVVLGEKRLGRARGQLVVILAVHRVEVALTILHIHPLRPRKPLPMLRL